MKCKGCGTEGFFWPFPGDEFYCQVCKANKTAKDFEALEKDFDDLLAEYRGAVYHAGSEFSEYRSTNDIESDLRCLFYQKASK